MQNKKVVYTAISGNRDNLPYINPVLSDWDYICFTTEDDIVSNDIWEVKYIKSKLDSVRIARKHKILAYNYLANYDVSVWIDGNVYLRPGWEKVVNECLDKSDITFMKHHENVKGAYHEGSRCIAMNKDGADVIKRQMNTYKLAGLPENEPVSSTRVLIRRHGQPNIITFSNIWYHEVLIRSRRDQISLPFARWRTGLKYNETIYKKLVIFGWMW